MLFWYCNQLLIPRCISIYASLLPTSCLLGISIWGFSCLSWFRIHFCSLLSLKCLLTKRSIFLATQLIQSFKFSILIETIAVKGHPLLTGRKFAFFLARRFYSNLKVRVKCGNISCLQLLACHSVPEVLLSILKWHMRTLLSLMEYYLYIWLTDIAVSLLSFLLSCCKVPLHLLMIVYNESELIMWTKSSKSQLITCQKQYSWTRYSNILLKQ